MGGIQSKDATCFCQNSNRYKKPSKILINYERMLRRIKIRRQSLEQRHLSVRSRTFSSLNLCRKKSRYPEEWVDPIAESKNSHENISRLHIDTNYSEFFPLLYDSKLGETLECKLPKQSVLPNEKLGNIRKHYPECDNPSISSKEFQIKGRTFKQTHKRTSLSTFSTNEHSKRHPLKRHSSPAFNLPGLPSDCDYPDLSRSSRFTPRLNKKVECYVTTLGCHDNHVDMPEENIGLVNFAFKIFILVVNLIVRAYNSAKVYSSVNSANDRKTPSPVSKSNGFQNDRIRELSSPEENYRSPPSETIRDDNASSFDEDDTLNFYSFDSNEKLFSNKFQYENISPMPEEIRPPTRASANLDLNRINLIFAGCGFVGIYHVGVAACLRKFAPRVSISIIVPLKMLHPIYTTD